MNQPLAPRLRTLLDALEAGLVERHQSVRLCLLAALAGEHTLLIGPPGTAKSELARRLHTAFADARYFERLLTRFTVPEELFGPLSIQALEDDRYERHTDGYLPTASIAFIDEVFKANSAILNALLTLLNERVFDNGAGRMRCPLLSVVGAANEVPEDAVSDAFFDRFLVRLPVQAVSDAGFAALLQNGTASAWTAPPAALALHAADLERLQQAAQQVTVPAPVVQVLGLLRQHLNAQSVVVSDRRWVKSLALLRVAAASEARDTVALWDVLLMPWMTAPDAERQTQVADWLAAHLGVHEAMRPERLATVLEAFERQLDNERNANDLDYDASGRLQFSATEIAAEIGDAKGGAAALRMHHSRKRRYGETHIRARQAQMDDVLLRLADGANAVRSCLAGLVAYTHSSLWLDARACAAARDHLNDTATTMAGLEQRAHLVRAGFAALPRLPQDNGATPEPVPLDNLHAP